jgi:uncharacterized membrane protein YdjX (TVP38/TMEM64 family)
MSAQNGPPKAQDGAHQIGHGWWWRPVLLIAAIALLWCIAWRYDLGHRLTNIRDWIDRLGLLGPLVYIMFRAGAGVAMIPGAAISATAGVLFGTVTGVVCVSAGKTLGAAAAFLISRHFARDAVARWTARKPRFASLDRLVREHGAVVVAVTRLLAVPYTFLNYAFGLTGISFGTYVFWSWLGMLPWAVFVVVGMSIVTETLTTGRVPWALVALFGATVLTIAALVVYALLRLRAATRVSSESEAEDERGPTPH